MEHLKKYIINSKIVKMLIVSVLAIFLIIIIIFSFIAKAIKQTIIFLTNAILFIINNIVFILGQVEKITTNNLSKNI